MKRKIIVIGIGAGNPEHVTIEAIKALNRASVLFIPDKGAEKAELARVRRDICNRYIENDGYRMVDFDVPPRVRPSKDYSRGIAEWRDSVERTYEQLIAEELGEGECGAFLVWGDPSLYDGTLRILDSLQRRGAIAFDYDVIPGISSVQALAARHRVPLNRVGGTVTITTGRRIMEKFPDGSDSVVVMLDADMAFMSVDGDMEIHWGAYVGTGDEILVSGRLAEVRDEIVRARAEARERHGWIMDTYLLTRPSDDNEA
jgi:precorrin-6A synthase (deacetylating)